MRGQLHPNRHRLKGIIKRHLPNLIFKHGVTVGVFVQQLHSSKYIPGLLNSENHLIITLGGRSLVGLSCTRVFGRRSSSALILVDVRDSAVDFEICERVVPRFVCLMR